MTIPRRRVLAGLAAGLAGGIGGLRAGEAGGPVFTASGPDAARYGAAAGYPVRRPIEDPANRVGAFSHFDDLYPTRRIAAAPSPWAFRRGAADIRYRHRGQPSSLADYPARNPVTGLLVVRGDEILFEHYQYGRSDRDRLLSQSMAKSLVGLLAGIAVAEGAIRSVDDPADAYVPALKGSEYGRTPLRALLHMSSGVAFGEEADGGRDLDRLWLDLMGGRLSRIAGLARGTVGGIRRFDHRIAPPGRRFHYSSIEADVLGLVVSAATGRTLCDYLHEKVWRRIGAEADASWLVDADGHELAHGFFSAVLRDYARLGRLLAHDGAWEGTQIVPASWMVEATTLRAADAHLVPGRADPTFGYGYLLWLLPWGRRQFALFGSWGQRICIDPASRLVLVHTAVEQGDEIWSLWRALVAAFGRA